MQGFRSKVEFLTEDTYDILGPRPIYHSAYYWIKAAQLPDQYAQVFADLARADDASFPYNNTPFSASCFRNLYNDYYATQEYMITAETNKETQAVLPPLLLSMEVVGGDELELSYDDWVYLITGFYPKNNKSQKLAAKVTKAGMMAPTMLVPFAESSTAQDPVLACRYSAVHDYSFDKNMIAVEPSFLCLVAGVWEQPNDQTVYDYGWGQKRYQVSTGFDGNKANPAVLDRGAPNMIDNMRNAQHWLADPTDADPLGTITKSSEQLSTINYWMNGEVRFDKDWDPVKILGSAASTSVEGEVSEVIESTEGSEAFFSQVLAHHGESVLQEFPDAK